MHDSSKLPNTLERFQLPSHRFVISIILVAMLSIVGICIAFANLHTRLATDVTQQNISNLLLMEQEFNQHLFVDLDDLVTSLVIDIQQDVGDTAIVLARYEQLLNHYPMLGQMQILDNTGAVIWQSLPEHNLTNSQIQMIIQRFLKGDQSNDLWIYPVEADADGEAIVAISHAFYTTDGQLQNIAVITVFAEQWGQSFSELTTLDSYSGYWINGDGYILTTFPYQPSLVGTQLTNAQQEILLSSNTHIVDSSTLLDDRPATWQSLAMDTAPLQLLIETPYVETHIFSDRVLAITFFISLAAVVSGIATIMLYMSQYRILQAQADTLFHTSQDLQQQITMRTQTETILADNEERYRRVTELISDYAFSTIVYEDGTRKREWLTDSFFTMTGYRQDDIGEKPVPEARTHPDDLAQVEADIERSLAGEDTVTEYRWRIKSGEYIWMRVKRRPIWDENHQRVVRLIGAVSDITVEKEAEIALRASEERYRIVTELMSDYAYLTTINEDGTGDREWLTDSFYQLSDFHSESLGSVPQPEQRTHPDDITQVEADIQRTTAGEETVSEYRWLTYSDNYIWLRVKRRPIWDENHQHVTHILGAVSDITAEKEAEAALRVSEDRYRRISSILTDFAYESYIFPDGSMQQDWTVGSINNNILLQPNQLTHISQISRNAHPDDVAKVQADLLLTTNNVETITEYRIKSEDGYRWVRSYRLPVWDEDERRVVRILGTIKDITAEKDAQQALEENQQRYRELTELMSDFAFSVTVNENDVITANWIVGSLEYITGIDLATAMADVGVIARLVYPDDQHLLKDDLRKNRNGEKTITEYRIIHAKTKQIRWLRVNRKPIIDPTTGQLSHALAGVTDITAEKHAAIALQQSEERYRQISELISDYVFSQKVFDDFSTEVEWKAGSINIGDISYADMSQMNHNQLPDNIHPEDYVEAMEDIMKTAYGETTISEFRVLNPDDGTTNWLRVSRQPIWDEDQNRVSRIIGAVSDVTVKKSIESALVKSEERYRLVTELISDYVYSLSVMPDNRIKMDWFAGSFEGITGTHIKDYVVESPLDMIKGAHPDDYEDAAAKIEQTMAGQSTVSEYRITNSSDKKPRWLRVSRFPTMDKQTGQLTRILGAVTDVTAQKFAEMALRDSEERYRLLTNLMTDYAFSVRFEEGGRLYCEWIIGDFEGVLGRSIPTSGYVEQDKFDLFTSDDLKRVHHDIERVHQGEASIVEYQIINYQDKKPRWLRTTRHPIWNKEHTRVIRYLAAVKDITLEKEAQLVSQEASELRQALEREKSLHALRTRFVSMVTHEFRNPLAAILSSVSILDKYDHRLTHESRREKFERIYGQVQRLTQLLEDLLEVGELEHHALHYTPQRIDVVDLVNDLYAEYEESIGSQHHLLVNTTHDKVHTYADVHILRQALGNIISNAIKYSPPESEVICDIILGAENVTIHVIDHGVGIPEAEYNELFEAFYRASNVSTQPGTGLGLLIAKQSIELHKGTIAFESEIGKGTTFTIQFPRVIGKDGDT